MTDQVTHHLTQLGERIAVIASSIITRITAIVIFLNLLLTQDWVVSIDGASEKIGQAITLLLGVVAMIRSVTPVDKDDRGLLPN